MYNAIPTGGQRLDIELTKDTRYLFHTGELLGVHCEYLCRKLTRYNWTRLFSFLPGQNGRHLADDISKWKILHFGSNFTVPKTPTDKSAWFGAEQATSHYLNQCWRNSLLHICSIRGRWVNAKRHKSIVLILELHPFQIKPSISNVCSWRSHSYILLQFLWTVTHI